MVIGDGVTDERRMGWVSLGDERKWGRLCFGMIMRME